MKKWIFVLIVAIISWKLLSAPAPVKLGAGVFAKNPPEQEPIHSTGYPFKGYTITPLETFHLTAKILSRKNYSSGRESELSPLDLALGWQSMSDETVLAAIDISQSNRWYRWSVKSFPIPQRDIETQSANMHLIPANDQIESLLDEARVGSIIELTGQLVRVDAEDGWHWISSLTRNDTGGGACEVIMVEKFRVVKF